MTTEKEQRQSENDIIEKKISDVPPTEKDKVQFVRYIQKLPKEDHLKIYHMLDNLDEKIYTISEKETLFDLNDLSNKDFWDIYLFLSISYKKITDSVIITSAYNEKESNEKNFISFIEEEKKKYVDI